MTNGWTGGQYSLYRALFGLYLFVHFAHLLPWGAELFSDRGALPNAGASPLAGLFPNVLTVADSPAAVAAVLAAAALASLLFAAGFHDRPAAGFLWYVWACLLGRNPLIANPGIPYVGWLLAAHVFVPPAPYGSLAAAGRKDPDGGWRLPGDIHLAAWLLMALGYSYSGYTKLASPSWLDGTALAYVLDNPLARPTLLRELLLSLPDVLHRLATWGALGAELLFAPLALSRRARPWLWLALLLMHGSLMTLVDFTDLSLGMIFLHLATFDPAWVRPAAGKATLFYDGDCGLCHRWVRFALAEDRSQGALRFAPLGGAHFSASVPEEERSGLPDSIVLRTEEGRLLLRSDAILHALGLLGGMWRVLGAAVRAVPRPVRDPAYDAVASVRKSLFAAPKEACPMLPAQLRGRFEA